MLSDNQKLIKILRRYKERLTVGDAYELYEMKRDLESHDMEAILLMEIDELKLDLERLRAREPYLVLRDIIVPRQDYEIAKLKSLLRKCYKVIGTNCGPCEIMDEIAEALK